MNNEFDTTLTSLLESIDNDPNQDIESLIEKTCTECGLSAEGKTELMETFGYLDAFTEKAASLQEYREEGKTRKRWIMDQMDAITEGRSEEEKAQIATAISETSENTVKEMLTNDEEK